MRQLPQEGHRTMLSQEALNVDVHDFLRTAAWTDDTALASEFHSSSVDIAALRRRLHRG
ncbi:MAG: hypothetical protein K6T83_23845 [Alicyclobacillus sp.]|nr:hypothetical protein [Alicyclobacillus sp.]